MSKCELSLYKKTFIHLKSVFCSYYKRRGCLRSVKEAVYMPGDPRKYIYKKNRLVMYFNIVKFGTIHVYLVQVIIISYYLC